MAKKGSKGEIICEHCGSSDMRFIRSYKKGEWTERSIYRCNKCGQEDYLDLGLGKYESSG